jgi:hypothetical protein
MGREGTGWRWKETPPPRWHLWGFWGLSTVRAGRLALDGEHQGDTAALLRLGATLNAACCMRHRSRTPQRDDCLLDTTTRAAGGSCGRCAQHQHGVTSRHQRGHAPAPCGPRTGPSGRRLARTGQAVPGRRAVPWAHYGRDGLLHCLEVGRYGSIEAAWPGAALAKKRITMGARIPDTITTT